MATAYPSSPPRQSPSSSSRTHQTAATRFRQQQHKSEVTPPTSSTMAHLSPPLTSSAFGASSSSSNRASFHPSSSSSPASTSSSSTTTTTTINPVMAAMSSGGSKLVARPATYSLQRNNDRPGSHRKRSSSVIAVQKIEHTQEELLDQAAGFNPNADWVNYKGAWVIHVVLILLGKILLDVVPGIRQDASWTIVNLGYIAISYLMFHHVTGTPFDANAGAYDQLTLWEQIDEGAQYTPAKKWLTSVPIGVFLISTHYTRYNLALFALNFGATFFVLLPKLPLLHRLRFKLLPGSRGGLGGGGGGISGTNSPYPSRPNTPAVSY